ncbi:MAG: alanine racemase, partial [Thermodesulfobacteriota bacterium]
MPCRPIWAEIDLDAIGDNVRAIRSAVGAQPHIMAVVKANAYGHGAVAVAWASLQAGATWLGVARLEEAIALREAGLTAPILILGHCPPGCV